MTNPILKPFDLEAAKAGKPVVDRRGQHVRIICFDAKTQGYPLVALIHIRGDEIPFSYTEHGRFYGKGDSPCERDLFMASTKREGFVNLYPPSINNHRQTVFHVSKNSADRDADSTRVACIRIEWDE
ncbi:hypothetical protein [Limnobaculum xujianqingii]|uniref:hypothetical protein n=1 Tax=Limnobaculum xujianqingii TaxID=2738837 RepID=UPI00112B371C|nr:hypothetical protein [Limnobaculum xujianqingii]